MQKSKETAAVVPSSETQTSQSPLSERKSFSPPAEPEWHRMISEAAYYLAEKRNFAAGKEMVDWLAAEADIHGVLSAAEAGPGSA